MKVNVFSLNRVTDEALLMASYSSWEEVEYDCVPENIEWDEDDIPEDYKIIAVEEGGESRVMIDFGELLAMDEVDEPWDLECGFDPYEGCYTYDC